jgi:hypothetical protein
MCNITKGRLDACNDSIGGIKNIYIWSYIDYRRYQIIVDDNTLTTYPNTDVYKYELRNDGNTFDENLVFAEDGIKYDQSINVVLKQSFINQVETSKLIDKRIGCIVETRNGLFQIIGLYNGCRVNNSSFTTGGAKQSLNGVNLSISAQETKQAFYIDNLSSAGFNVVGEETNDFLLLEDGFYLLQENGFKIIL